MSFLIIVGIPPTSVVKLGKPYEFASQRTNPYASAFVGRTKKCDDANRSFNFFMPCALLFEMKPWLITYSGKIL